jgi:signal transduction histidine kinase
VRQTTEKKSGILTRVLHRMGYGEGIHAFKNYILRNDLLYYKRAKRSLGVTVRLLGDLRAMKINQEEQQAITDVETTLTLYLTMLERARRAKHRSEVLALDRLVKVDDRQAIKGLRKVLKSYFISLTRQRREGRRRTWVALLSMVLLLLMLFYSFLRLERTNFQLHESNAKLHESNEELTQFAYRTSHDLRSPLLRSRQFADLIVSDIEAGEFEDAAFCAKAVQKQMANLEKVVTDILSLTKADMEVNTIEQVDFEALLVPIKERLAWLLEDSRCELQEQIDVSPEFCGQPTRLTQILENLLSNALKYQDQQEKEPLVKLSIQETHQTLEIVVEDNGEGIPEGKQKELFQMFKRFHRRSGSGLGLAIVKKHVDVLQGNINVTRLDQGTRFVVSLPKEQRT